MKHLARRLRNRLYHVIDRSRLCSLFNLTVTARFNGRPVKIPIIKGLGFGNLVMSEMWMLDLLGHLLTMTKGIFMDVGVNIGQTLVKLKSIDPGVPYVGLEPNPTCVYYTGELIRANRFVDCTLVPVALFSATGLLELELFHDDAVDSSASLIRDFRPGQKTYRKQYVPAFTFDDVAGVIAARDVGVIKIDVEGAELEVMKSLEKTISRYRPLILIEVLPLYSADNRERKDRQDDIERLLRELNYRMFRVMKTKRGELSGLVPLSTIGVHSDLNQCDYVFAPFELEVELSALSLIYDPSDQDAEREAQITAVEKPH